MRVTFHPHGNKPWGYIPPILDRDGKVMISAQLVRDTNHEKVTRVFEPGERFDIDEKADPHLAAFCKLHDDFMVLNASAYPKKEP